MKRLDLLSVSLVTALLFCACSDDGDSSVNATSLNVSSSSLLESSSEASSAETNKSISSSSEVKSSESGNSVADDPVSSSSVDVVSSSSLSADLPTFSKYLAQFAAPGENALDFDSHVIAYNTYFSINCEDKVVSYNERDEIVLLKSISNEDIAECFPKTTEFLNKKFSSKDNVKFYAATFYTGVTPLAFVLNEFASDSIRVSAVSPTPESGKACYQESTGPIAMFLVADTDGLVKDENVSIAFKSIKSEIWKCSDGSSPDVVKAYGEWFSDSLL